MAEKTASPAPPNKRAKKDAGGKVAPTKLNAKIVKRKVSLPNILEKQEEMVSPGGETI